MKNLIKRIFVSIMSIGLVLGTIPIQAQAAQAEPTHAWLSTKAYTVNFVDTSNTVETKSITANLSNGVNWLYAQATKDATHKAPVFYATQDKLTQFSDFTDEATQTVYYDSTSLETAACGYKLIYNGSGATVSSLPAYTNADAEWPNNASGFQNQYYYFLDECYTKIVDNDGTEKKIPFDIWNSFNTPNKFMRSTGLTVTESGPVVEFYCDDRIESICINENDSTSLGTITASDICSSELEYGKCTAVDIVQYAISSGYLSGYITCPYLDASKQNLLLEDKLLKDLYTKGASYITLYFKKMLDYTVVFVDRKTPASVGFITATTNDGNQIVDLPDEGKAFYPNGYNLYTTATGGIPIGQNTKIKDVATQSSKSGHGGRLYIEAKEAETIELNVYQLSYGTDLIGKYNYAATDTIGDVLKDTWNTDLYYSGCLYSENDSSEPVSNSMTVGDYVALHTDKKIYAMKNDKVNFYDIDTGALVITEYIPPIQVETTTVGSFVSRYASQLSGYKTDEVYEDTNCTVIDNSKSLGDALHLESIPKAPNTKSIYLKSSSTKEINFFTGGPKYTGETTPVKLFTVEVNSTDFTKANATITARLTDAKAQNIKFNYVSDAKVYKTADCSDATSIDPKTKTLNEIFTTYGNTVYLLDSSYDLVAYDQTGAKLGEVQGLSGNTLIMSALTDAIGNRYTFNASDIYVDTACATSADTSKYISNYADEHRLVKFYVKNPEPKNTGDYVAGSWRDGTYTQAWQAATGAYTVDAGHIVTAIDYLDITATEPVYLPAQVNSNVVKYDFSSISFGDHPVIIESGAYISGIPNVPYICADGPIHADGVITQGYFGSKLTFIENFGNFVPDGDIILDETFSNCDKLEVCRFGSINSNNSYIAMKKMFNSSVLRELSINDANFRTVEALFVKSVPNNFVATFTDCDFAAFVSKNAFKNGIGVYHFNRCSNTEGSDFKELFAYTDFGSNNLTVTGLVVNNMKGWFKGSTLNDITLDDITVTGLSDASEMCKDAKLSASNVVEILETLDRASNSVNISSLFANAQFKDSSDLDVAIQNIGQWEFKPSAADYFADFEGIQNVEKDISYANMDLSLITQFTPVTKDFKSLVLPKVLPEKLIVPGAHSYYLSIDDATQLVTLPATNKVLLKSSLNANSKLYSRAAIIKDTDVVFGTTKTYTVPIGVEYGSIFSYSIYSDENCKLPIKLTDLTINGTTVIYHVANIEYKTDDKTKTGVGFKLNATNIKSVTFKDDKGATHDLIGTGDTKLELDLTVNSSNSISDSIKKSYTTYAESAVYDLTLCKVTESGEKIVISELSDPITITCNIPSGYKSGEPLAVYNYHNGTNSKPTSISANIQDGKLVLNTTTFSPYLVLYNNVGDTDYEFYTWWNDDSNKAKARPSQLTGYSKVEGVKYKDANVAIGSTETYQLHKAPGVSKIAGVTPTVEYWFETPTSYIVTTTTHEGKTCFQLTYSSTGTDKKKVKVVFDDDSNKAGLRPADVTVTLSAEGATSVPVKFTIGKESTTKEFEQEASVIAGKTYKIESAPDIDKYTKTISDMTVTYKYSPEMIKKTATVKFTGDGEDLDKTRPASVEVTYKSGDQSYKGTVSASTNWSCNIEVPKFIKGVEAQWTLSGATVDKYESSVSGDTITYKFTGTLSKEAAAKEAAVKAGLNASTLGTAGADYSIDMFDWIDYSNLYPDLYAKYGYNKEALYTHYMLFGQKEGRVATFTGKYANMDMDVIEKYAGSLLHKGEPKTGSSTDSATKNDTKVSIDEKGNTVITQKDGNGKTVVSTYDPNGNLISTKTYKTGDNRLGMIGYFLIPIFVVIIGGFVYLEIKKRKSLINK